MSELGMAIKKLVESSDEIYSTIGLIKSVDRENNTVDVIPVNDDAEVLDVRLQSDLASTKGIVLYPVVGSFVIITWINVNTAYVAMCEEVEEVKLNIDGQEFRIDRSGVAHKTGNSDLSKTVSDLMTLLNDVLTNLKTFKVICSSPGSPSGAVFPDNLSKLAKSSADLKAIESSFKQLLNEY